MAHESNNLAIGLLPWALKRKREFESNVVTNPELNGLPAKSWQEIQLMYEVYGGKLVYLAKFAKLFENKDINHIDVYAIERSYRVVRHAWQLSVDETDGMLILLDAEIARRNNLIGVMG